MGGRQYRTLGDLRGDSLMAKCRGCGHCAKVSPLALLKFGAGTPISRLRLRCSLCGSRAVDVWVERLPSTRHWLDAFLGEKKTTPIRDA